MTPRTERAARAWLRARVADERDSRAILSELLALVRTDKAHEPLLASAVQSGRISIQYIHGCTPDSVRDLARALSRCVCVASPLADRTNVHEQRVRALAVAGRLMDGATDLVVSERSCVVRELGMLAMMCAPALDDAVDGVVDMVQSFTLREDVLEMLWQCVAYEIFRAGGPMAPPAVTAVAVRMALAMPYEDFLGLMASLGQLVEAERFVELVRRHERDVRLLLERALLAVPIIVQTLLSHLDAKYVDLVIECHTRLFQVPDATVTAWAIAMLRSLCATDETRALCKRMPDHALRRIWSPDMALEQALFHYAEATGDVCGLRAFLRGYVSLQPIDAMAATTSVTTLTALMRSRYCEQARTGDERTVRFLYSAPSCDADALHEAVQRLFGDDDDICPITQQPIVLRASDAVGRRFERDYLVAWVLRDQRNPICRSPMTINDITVHDA